MINEKYFQKLKESVKNGNDISDEQLFELSTEQFHELFAKKWHKAVNMQLSKEGYFSLDNCSYGQQRS